MVVLAFAYLNKIPCCIYSEAPASTRPLTLSSRLKRPIQRLIVRLLRTRVLGVLAISWRAQRAFVSLGFPKSKIYRFGYFEKMPGLCTTEVAAPEASREILYVGRLVKGKGLELLIEAGASLLQSDPRLRLRIIGGGVIEARLRRLIHEHRLESQTLFTGVVPSSSVPGFLQKAAMLVLPSEDDGWGIVINQALQAGTPAIVSDSCGAAELVANGMDGYIVRTGDRLHLAACMRAVLDHPHPEQMRVTARQAGCAASAECAAPYLLHCLEHMMGLRSDRPVPKWILNDEPKPAQLP
jgi:glycosyltransferase involved in cell wall biosynthesis